MAIIVSDMAKQEGVTEALEAADQMEWVRRMNSIRSRAEEIVVTELVYESTAPVIGCMADNGHLLRFNPFPGCWLQASLLKITLILTILNDTVFLKLALGKGFCNRLLSLFLYDAALLPR